VFCYLFYEKIHVQQKVTHFMEDGPCFLQKAESELLAAFWFSELKDAMVLNVDGVPKTRPARRKVGFAYSYT
jgi:hypothetical protein